MSQPLLKIGAVAAQAGVTTRTVDYYTALGLISPAARTDGSFRLYEQNIVERINTIRQLESLGVSLNDLAKALPTSPQSDLAPVLERLDRDLHVLRTTTTTTHDDARDLLLAAATRAHDLITAALDIALTLPPVT